MQKASVYVTSCSVLWDMKYIVSITSTKILIIFKTTKIIEVMFAFSHTKTQMASSVLFDSVKQYRFFLPLLLRFLGSFLVPTRLLKSEE